MSALSLEPTPSLCPGHDPRGLGGLLVPGPGGQQRALPLTRVEVRARLAGSCGLIELTQRFRNDLTEPMEAVHIFPLPEDGALTEVELICGELTVRAELKERQEAEQTFQEARAAGHRAALVTQERDDVHTLRVTNLPAGEEVTVKLTVVQRIPLVDGRFRFRFPTVIAPRFLVGDATGHHGPGHQPDTDRVPDASRLSPPLRLAGGTELDLEVLVAGPVRQLASSLHAIGISMEQEGVRIAPSGQAVTDRDFALAWSHGDEQDLAVRAWTDGRHTLALIAPPTLALPPALPRDAVFIVDISGSMGGRKMEAARQALLAALHGLMPGDRFKLIAFDNRLEFFHKQFSTYDDRSLAAADRWIHGLEARGGTRMLPAIQAGLAGDTPSGRLRTVLFITDGQAHNEAELTACVAGRRGRARFFTMGIDSAVNGGLLKRLARVGAGTCELLTPQDDIEEAVARLEARFGSPVLTEVRAAGDTSQPQGTVFAGRPLALLIEGAPDTLELEAHSPEGPWRQRVAPQPLAFPIGTLWARERITRLTDRLLTRPYEEEAIRAEVIRLGLAWSIATRWTSFVAVERSRVVGDGAPTEVVQPVPLPHGWEAQDAPARPGPPKRRPRRSGGAPRLRKMRTPPNRSARRSAPGAPPPMPPMPSPAMPSPVASQAAPTQGLPAPAPEPAKGYAPERKERGGRSLMDRIGGFFGGRRSAAPPPPAPAARMDSIGLGDVDDEAEGAGVLMDSLDLGIDRDQGRSRLSEHSAPAEERAASVDPAAIVSQLARSQGADGSFGGDVARTAAALVALVLAGHTRRSGSRRRVVLKAARWLSGRSEPLAALALRWLTQAEAGGSGDRDSLRPLFRAGPEGSALARLVRA